MVQCAFLIEVMDFVAVCRVWKDVPGVVWREVFERDGVFERGIVGEHRGTATCRAVDLGLNGFLELFELRVCGARAWHFHTGRKNYGMITDCMRSVLRFVLGNASRTTCRNVSMKRVPGTVLGGPPMPRNT